MGLNLRSYGLACDQVTQVEMVNYLGQLLTANAANNSDLFWASCGGGGRLPCLCTRRLRGHIVTDHCM